jgi:hypothetical protein
VNLRDLCCVAVVTGLLAGCSGSLLGGGAPAPSAEAQIPVNNTLAMPPDLSLRQPGTGVAAAAPALDVDDGAIDTGVAPVVARPAPKPPMGEDIYAKYGIDVNNPDGTRKPPPQLQKELRAAIVAEKRRTNPSYGTIFNVGGLFND